MDYFIKSNYCRLLTYLNYSLFMTLMVCFHCLTPRPRPVPIPITMKLGSMIMIRSVYTEPIQIPIPILIRMQMATVPNLVPISVQVGHG